MTTATHTCTCARPTTARPARVAGAVGTAPVPRASTVAVEATAPAALTVTVERQEQRTRLVLVGELEATTAPLLDCLVADALDRQRGELVLDLSQTSFCDVRGLDCLLAARRRAHAGSRRLHLLGAAPVLRHLLRLSGAADVLGPED